MSISVLGGGAFGTALAIALAGQGPLSLWARDPSDMETKRENTKRLPNCPFPDQLAVTGNLAQALSAQTILLALPMQKLRDFLRDHAPVCKTKHWLLVAKVLSWRRGLVRFRSSPKKFQAHMPQS